MTLHPAEQAILDFIAKAGLPPFHDLGPVTARVLMDKSAGRFDRTDAEVLRVQDRTIPGRFCDIPVRIYWPREPEEGGLAPITVFYHGGGWVFGSLTSHDVNCRSLALEGDCIVISVGYRMAPEDVFPAAVDDAMDAYQWVLANAAELGADATRVAIAGDSAGGNLSAVVAILAREQGMAPPVLQLLIYPVTAPAMQTASAEEFSEGHLLERKTMDWFYELYVGDDAAARADYRFAPLLAEDLSDLPPALVITAGCDPLRDEGIEYARRLMTAGNKVTLSNYPGMLHGFMGHQGRVEDARKMLAQCGGALRAAFGAA